MSLEGIDEHAMVYFSIKAEDEMQNRSGLSNSPGIQCSFNPADISAIVKETVYVFIDWEGPLPGDQLLHYEIFRKFDQDPLALIQTGVMQTEFTDNLKNKPDGTYRYAVCAIYSSGSSDTVFATPVVMERFVNVGLLLSLSGTNDYQGIQYVMTGLDEIYTQQFIGTTNSTGIELLDDVFFSQYKISAIKYGYENLLDTLEVSKMNNTFALALVAVNPGSVPDNPDSGKTFFTIRPNPTDGVFTLEMADPQRMSVIHVEIFDMMGKQLKKVEFSGMSSYKFDLSGFPGGIYLIRITENDNQGVLKVILME
jgi:hypothetical protein